VKRLKKLERHSTDGALLHVLMAEPSKVLEPSILKKMNTRRLATQIIVASSLGSVFLSSF
jgi:hypothetical protein